ncbi:hypothetical protein ACB098_05G077900 [Castanea mollissima]
MLIIKLCNTWLALNGIAGGLKAYLTAMCPSTRNSSFIPILSFKLAKSRSDYHLVTITLTCVHHKNTIRGLPTNVVAMSHSYTTSPSDIFAPFYLK